MAGFRDRSTGSIELRVIPHPSVTLVLEFGDGSLVMYGATDRQQRGSFVGGLAPGSVHMRGKNIECVEVRLSPVVARAVLGAHPAESDHSVVALDDLWGRDAARIREQLSEIASWDARFAVAEASLTRRAAAGPLVDPEVVWAWDRIVVSRGSVRVEDLAVELGWSRRRLWTRFRSQMGLPPKRAAKLVRFNHAAHRLAAGDSAARVAAECGYADQSHLHRDVWAFTEMTPAALADDPGFAANQIAYPSRGTFVQDRRPRATSR
ncbi:helix-turn-helix domain-containing protein [Nocardia terpenica]|uniref:helix-turn-helix domain-containing protein n=1 Tax=Nocardia terpenica TaxID=455432 RepID=UPI00189578B0|nr:helix-turn-helix domain-containing protein [Nocardia terpenica]MBF6059867.1 helix-turn-helix domain-containing protein [Nocardia terpenica]MBF6102592.1 helix-turn-helix domain-containing protein [Nocardia terpenica]MBF6111217.1 helix-turn-helix domain-containing protein [Nocardia terpenica]MBF6117348.1 helix-turn-helix domain-containing protein [Nocardia terpenica]MBF6150811.1 helix-turn-helix domain-containing protein [Nocardia terpenica]